MSYDVRGALESTWYDAMRRISARGSTVVGSDELVRTASLQPASATAFHLGAHIRDAVSKGSTTVIYHCNCPPSRCRPSHLQRLSSRRPIRRPTRLRAGSRLHRPSTRKRAICISRLPMPSRSTSSSGRPGMLMLARQNAGRSAKNLTKQRTHGGTRRRRTREAILTVRRRARQCRVWLMLYV